ncbi:MAG: hypothetical protein WCL22_06960 [bacterium]
MAFGYSAIRLFEGFPPCLEQIYVYSQVGQKEIERFQKRAEELAEERRVTRRGLSEDVNSLGRRLQILNLLIGPAIAGLFGLLYALYRRRKSA